MGKTLKDKANHFLHHLRPDSSMYMVKSKACYDKEDVPSDVKRLVEVLAANCPAGSRYGNNRKFRAKAKVYARKSERMQHKSDDYVD